MTGLLCVGLLAPTRSASAAESTNLMDMSIEELMNESVTSVSKKEQKVSEAPAAIYVLTADDILRAGHATIPEALRMVPGLSVAQLGSHDWIITSRGFAAQFAGKLLVLIDGRTVYNPFFSGVHWDVQDLLLEDLDRIEIIRGPGATLWGANAVNGVINIITKKAADSQGALATAGGGTEWYGGGFRYGGKLSDKAHYRVYLKYDDHDDFVDFNGNDAGDSWRVVRGGFRTDWQPTDQNLFTFQGDLYSGELNGSDELTSLTPPYLRTFPGDAEVSGGNILGRWSHTLSDSSSWSLQTYYDRTERQDVQLGIKRDIFDAEFQHQFDLGARNSIVYGAGYRFTRADYEDSFFLSYESDHDSSHLVSAFIQDDIALVKEKLKLTLGSKFEHNDFSGFEVQPSGRLLWTPNHQHSVWGSVSRAVKTPNFGDTALRINHTTFDADGPGPAPPTVISILPNEDLRSESVIAYELGYRLQPRKNLYLDLATFYNVYDDLVVDESTGAGFEISPLPPHLAITSRTANKMHGETYGVEFAPSWNVTDWWKLSAGYTWLQMNLHSEAPGRSGEEQEGDSPKQQFHIRSFLHLPHNFTFDTAAYYVDTLPNQAVSSYVRLDVRLGWRPTKDLELSFGAVNLLDDRHPEFRSFAFRPLEAQRSFYGKLTWRF